MSASTLAALKRFSRIRFHTEDDALSHARHIREQARKVMIGEGSGRVECYLRGYSELQLSCRWRQSEDFTLISRIVPNGCDNREMKISFSPSDSNAVDVEPDHENVLVLGWVRKFTEEREEVVPACVSIAERIWRQLQQIGVNLVWDALPRTSAARQLASEGVLPTLSIPKGEVCVLEAAGAEDLGCRIDGFVESAPDFGQVPHRVTFDIIGDVGRDPDFIYQLSGIRIALGNGYKIALVDESLSSLLQVTDILVQPLKGQPGAVEWIYVPAHGGKD